MDLSLWRTDFFFFNDPATTEIYTLSLHDALPISALRTPPHQGPLRLPHRTRSRRPMAHLPPRRHRDRDRPTLAGLNQPDHQDPGCLPADTVCRVQLTVVDHPLARARLTKMRDERTDNAMFRAALAELTQMLVYEATRDLAVAEEWITTPVTATTGYRLAAPPLIVPVLRAGLGMADTAHRSEERRVGKE